MLGVAGDGAVEVEVVGSSAAGQHRVLLLAGHLAGGDSVHGVGGDALDGVHGGGVAEVDGLADIGRGQGQGPPGGDVFDVQGAGGGDGQDPEPVAVLDPVVPSVAQAPLVAAGDDQVAGAGGVAVGQPGDGLAGLERGVGEAVGSGALVEVADEVSGGGDHDGVQAGEPVGEPAGEAVVGEGVEVADVDAVVVGVEGGGFVVAVAERDRGGGFGGVVEADHVGEFEGALGGDVAQHAAGADGGELLVVADEADAGAAAGQVGDGGVEVEGGGHGGLVDDDQRPLIHVGCPVGHVAAGQSPGQGGQGVGVAAGLRAESGRGRGGGGEPDRGAAGVGPGRREGLHGGGFAGPGRRDR